MTKNRINKPCALRALLAIVLLNVNATSQDAVRLPKLLQHEVSVTVKLIQVYVTDKAGKPVGGLKKEDFVLTDDGRRQTITDFEEHVLTLAPRASPSETRLDVTPLASAPRLLGRKFFLFFDFAYNDSWGIKKASEMALDFLDNRLFPLDEVAVVTYAGLRRLRVPLYLTRDHTKARSLVSRIGGKEAAERVDEGEDAYARDVSSGGFRDAHEASPPSWNLASPGKPDLQADERRQAEKCIDSLIALAQALRYESGQKYLVVLSWGIPYRALYHGDQVSPVARRDGGFVNPEQFAELRDKSEQLLKELATSNVTVFAINTQPLSAASELERSGTLQKWAQATGGQFWGNAQNFQPFLEKIQAATGSYYVLGYPVSEAWDGKYHRLKVAVGRPGLEVRTQAGYFAPKPFAEFSEIEKRIHLVDVALAENPLSQRPIRLGLAAQACSTSTKDNLCLAASLPIGSLGEIVVGRVEILRLAFNAGDEIVDEQKSEEDLRGLKSGTAHVVSLLSAPGPGTYRCRIVVRNLESGRCAVAGATAVVPPLRDGALRIFPPLFLKSERGAIYLNEGPARPPSGKATPPQVSGPIFDRALYAPIIDKTLRVGGEITATICVAGPSAAEARISAVLFDKLRWEAIPVPLEILERSFANGAAAFLVRIMVPEVEPDTYTFILSAERPAGGEPAAVSMDVALERGEGRDRNAN